MHVIFDMGYDQRVAPNGLAAGSAVLGQVYAGPGKLLELLETRLGLIGKVIHQEMRIQHYMDCMQQCVDKKNDAAVYFAASFAADPWSSAKQMLGWRDELVNAGWDGRNNDNFTPKLKAMASVESLLETALIRGEGDRLQTVLACLDGQSTLAISCVELAGTITKLPTLLQRLMQRLSACGVAIHEREAVVAPSSGNLEYVKQAMLAGTERNTVADRDDSLLLLQAEDEWSAANAVAAWLAADRDSNTGVLLIQGEGSQVLDAALSRTGLPIPGTNQCSRWRASLQILPLMLANIWEPLNIHALLEFLSLPVSPLPGYVARALSKAIQETPGVGGEPWRDAEITIATKCRQQWKDDGKSDKQASAAANKLLSDIHTFLIGCRFDPTRGIPAVELVRICNWVKQGLSPYAQSASVQQAIAQVDRFVALAEGQIQAVSRTQVERMLDSVIAGGANNPASVSEASPWMVVSDPSAISDPVETVIWWNFTDTGQSSLTCWSKAEQRALTGIGIQIETSAHIRQRQAEQEHRALRYAGKHLLLVSPTRVKGEAARPHPLWDEIRHFAVANDANPEAVEHLVKSVSDLNSAASCDVAGRTLNLAAVEPFSLLPPEANLRIKKGVVAKPESLSFSQMEMMIGCPARWVLHKHAKLHKSNALDISSGNRMIGSLCHKVVEKLYKQPDSWTAATLRATAEKLFDQLVPEMAAELQEPGRELDYQRYRYNVCSAVESLCRAIERAGLHVIATEQALAGKSVDQIPFGGSIDMVLKDDHGALFVIDLKWSGSSKYKREDIESGTALQLASYAWALQESGADWTPGAYFMLAQGELLTDNEQFQALETLESKLSSQMTWQQGLSSWLHCHLRVRNGDIEVSGLVDEETLQTRRETDGMLNIKPQCRFCDFGKLCGKTRAAA